MTGSSAGSGTNKEDFGSNKTKSTPFSNIFKQLKQGSFKGLKSEKSAITDDIKKKIKDLNKKFHDSVAYGKDVFSKAFQFLNNRIGTVNKSLLPQKYASKGNGSKTDTGIKNENTEACDDQDCSTGAKHEGTTTSVSDDDIDQQTPEIHLKSASLEGHVKKKTLNLINSLKNISAMNEKKEVPHQGQKLVGIVS